MNALAERVAGCQQHVWFLDELCCGPILEKVPNSDAAASASLCLSDAQQSQHQRERRLYPTPDMLFGFNRCSSPLAVKRISGVGLLYAMLACIRVKSI